MNIKTIIEHFCLVGEITNKEKVLLLVEKEYLAQISRVFWESLQREFFANFGKHDIVFYKTDKNTQKTDYFDSQENALSERALDYLFENNNVCLDFLITGEAFYKTGSPFFCKTKNLLIVRMLPENWKLFSYNKKQVKAVIKHTESIKQYLRRNKNVWINSLEFVLSKELKLYSGRLLEAFQVGEIRVLPIGIGTICTTEHKALKIYPSTIKFNGKLNLEEALCEVITERRGAEYGKLSIEITSNKVTRFKFKDKTHTGKDDFEVAHLTFGTNPFINSPEGKVETAERQYGWICLGIENPRKTHIDICFEHKIL